MALYHFSVKQVSRGKGQSVVASAAYDAGEKLTNEYYGEINDYSKKSGVKHTEIMLPPNAPERFLDRGTLWNEVESIEKHPKAQLAFSFNVALQNEFSFDENLELVRTFIKENMIAKGMIVDFAVHEPDKGNHGVSNPHFHMLAPIRPLNDDGSWGDKQRREYYLTDDGQKKFNAVPTTDWGRPETLEKWREEWARLCNEKFKEKGLSERIDNRSFEKRGLDKLPTIHEGPAVRAMEEKGIETDIGSRNKDIKETNNLIDMIVNSIKSLSVWIESFMSKLESSGKEDRLHKLESEHFKKALDLYFDDRNRNAYSQTAKINNLKEYSKVVCFLNEKNITTFNELVNEVGDMYGKVRNVGSEIRDAEFKLKEIKNTFALYETYKDNEKYYKKLHSFKWKSDAVKYKNYHEGELRLFYMARRKLKELYPDGIPFEKLEERNNELLKQIENLHKIYEELSENADKLYSLKKAIEYYNNQLERQNLNYNRNRGGIEL